MTEMTDKSRLEALARLVAVAIDGAPARPKLRVVPIADFAPTPPERMDPVTRESHLRAVRSTRRAFRQFGFDLLVNQALIGKSRIEDLDDSELIALHRDLDRARECITDDVTFEEAGLLRSCRDADYTS